MMNRRSFLGAGSLALLAAGCQSAAPVLARRRPDGLYTLGKVPFKLGMAGYTYHKMTLDKTLEALQKLDVHYLCIKDFHLPIKSTQAEIDAFKRKCSDFDVVGYGVGPIYMDAAKPDFVKEAFDYAARIGVKTVVGVPFEMREIEGKKVRHESRALCETLSGLCDEYKVNYAIHNHGPDIPYLFPNAESIWAVVKDLGPRMGMCLDIGHQFRDNRDPATAIRQYSSRLFDLHLKNVSDNSKKGSAQPLPRGKIDLEEVVKALCDVGYSGCCSLEYERNFSDNYAEIAECIGYFRGLMDSVRS